MIGLSSQSSIARLVHVLAGCVLLLVAICGIFVLNSAGTIADDLHRKDTKLLVQNEVSRLIAIVAKDQSQISNWDETLEALGDEIDMDFVRREIANWLWEDFDIHSTIVVGPDAEPRVTVHEDNVLLPAAGRALIHQSSDLVEAATKLYLDNRERVSGGYSFPIDPTRPGTISYASDFREIDGKLNIVLAQAIVPSEGFILPAGNPHILLVYKVIDDEVLQNISDKLKFDHFALTTNPIVTSEKEMSVRVGDSELWAVWSADSPSTAIWRQTLPLMIIMLVLAGGTLAAFSLRYGRLLSELHKNQEENRFLALHDALTGLPNRAQFNQIISDVSERGTFSGCAVLCIDLDRFKEVNDTYGHHYGDAVLAEVAGRISNAVGDLGIVARMGGDEFIVFMQEIPQRDIVLEVCDEIVSSVAKDIQIEDGAANVGASIGVAYWPNIETTANLVIQSADKALYQAKENGRSCVYVADDDHQREALPSLEAA